MKALERGCRDASTEEDEAEGFLERVDFFVGGGGSSWAS